jgi:hypothetical protein
MSPSFELIKNSQSQRSEETGKDISTFGCSIVGGSLQCCHMSPTPNSMAVRQMPMITAQQQSRQHG